MYRLRSMLACRRQGRPIQDDIRQMSHDVVERLGDRRFMNQNRSAERPGLRFGTARNSQRHQRIDRGGPITRVGVLANG